MVVSHKKTRRVWLGSDPTPIGVIEEAPSLRNPRDKVWVPIPHMFEVDDVQDAQREFGEFTDAVQAAISLGRFCLAREEDLQFPT